MSQWIGFSGQGNGGRITRIYMLESLVEANLVIGWIFSLLFQRKNNS